jgi:hypothetical protein
MALIWIDSHASYWRAVGGILTAHFAMSCISPILTMPVFLRRLGPDPHANGAQTQSLSGCPDILELATGDFAVIGIDITAETIAHLPVTVGCGPDERIVRIPRKTLVLARSDIPKAL